MEAVNHFVATGTMPQLATDKYALLVPPELAVLWTDYGIGTFHDGYLRIVNPDDWMQLVQDSHHGFSQLIPIITTAMGDINGWAGELLLLLDYRHGLVRTLFSEKYFPANLDESAFMEDELHWPLTPRPAIASAFQTLVSALASFLSLPPTGLRRSRPFRFSTCTPIPRSSQPSWDLSTAL